VIFDSLLRISDELLDLFIDDILHLRVQLNTKVEEPDKVEQTPDGHNADVGELLDQALDVGDHQLGEHLDDHLRAELLPGALVAEELEGLLQEVDAALFLVNGVGLFNDLELFLSVDLHLLRNLVLYLKNIVLTEVQRQPVSELIIGQTVSNLMFHKSSHAEKILGGRYHPDLSSPGQSIN
jgi:hypothetical protein